MSKPPVFALVVGLVAVAFLTQASAQDKLTAPPYLVSGSNHVLVGVTWDEAVVREMLPPGVEPAADMSGGINIYHTGNGYGIGSYQSSYFWVNLEGVDSADGTKGRWILQGVYGPADQTSAALRVFYGWPVRNGTARHEPTNDGLRAFGTVNGNDFVAVEIKGKPDTCHPVAGTLNYLAEDNDSGAVAVNQIPYIGDFCEAEPVSVEVMAPAGDPFAKFKPASVTWAGQFKNGTFAFSRPLPMP